VAAHRSSHRHHGMLSTDSDSERPLRRWPGPSRTRMMGCNGGCAGCEPGTRWTQGRTRGAAGGGGSGSVPAPTASPVPASWPPEKCNGFLGWNGRLKRFGGWLPFAIACAADPVVCVAGDRRTNPAVSGSRQIMRPGCQDEPVFFSKKAAMPVREPTSCQACVSKYQIFHWRNEKQPLSLFSAPGVVGSLSKLVFQSRVLD
jgi:hypothetical protein